MNVITWDGQPISAPGIYAKVPNRTYHGQLTVTPSVSRSVLRTVFGESPAHAFATHYLNPHRTVQEPSEAMLLGRAAHHIALGEERFRDFFAVRPVKWDSWREKAARAWRADQELEGKDVLEPKHLEIVQSMVMGLHANSLVRAGILNGLIEHTIVYRDELTGLWCKVRPDALPMDGPDFADLKTIADISDDGIERAIGENGLAMQAAMTREAARAVFGEAFAQEFTFSFVFIEKKVPFCCRVKMLKPADLDLGDLQVRLARQLFARCLERGVWGGPGGDQTDADFVEMKPYARNKIQYRCAQIEKELAI